MHALRFLILLGVLAVLWAAPASAADALFLDCPGVTTANETNVTVRLYAADAPACDVANVFVNSTLASGGFSQLLSPASCADGRHAFTLNTSTAGNYTVTAFETSGAYATTNATCLLQSYAAPATNVPDLHPALALLALLAAAILLSRRHDVEQENPHGPK